MSVSITDGTSTSVCGFADRLLAADFDGSGLPFSGSGTLVSGSGLLGSGSGDPTSDSV